MSFSLRLVVKTIFCLYEIYLVILNILRVGITRSLAEKMTILQHFGGQFQFTVAYSFFLDTYKKPLDCRIFDSENR